MQLNMKYLERFTLHKMGWGAKGRCVVIWLSSLEPGCSVGSGMARMDTSLEKGI